MLGLDCDKTALKPQGDPLHTDHQKFRSVCRICHGGCAAWLTVRDGVLVGVRPCKESAYSQGQMCVKGLRTVEMMYHPDRLLHPLQRVGARGSGQWRRISWDEALSAIARRLSEIRAESGAESVALGQGTGRSHYFHVIRFANTFGTPNWYEPGLANCFIPRITVCHLTYGGFVTPDYLGEVTPRTILFWGHNPLVSNADGELAPMVRRALRQGATGVAIDPRRSETARRCALWLPLRPGTDDALALAMIRHIIEEGLHDREFVAAYTNGFAELRERVRHCTLEWAEGITGVAAGDIAKAAELYATQKPSVIEWGVAIEQNPNCLQTVRAIAVLRGLTGNLDRPGADVFGMNAVRPFPVLRNLLPEGMLHKRIGAKEFKLLGGGRAYMPSAHIPGVFRAMREGDPYRIRALLLWGNNPLLSVANSRGVLEALQRLDLLVACDLFMTPSAALADFVLPGAFWPEADQLLELPLVAGNAVFAQQKVVQVGECRQIEAILHDLATRLDLPEAELGLHDILDYRLAPLGLSFAQLKERFQVNLPLEYEKFKTRGFRTPTRKVELYCKALERLGYDPLPSYTEPPESPLATPQLAEAYPLVLTTGARRPEFFHSEHRQIAALRRSRPDPLAELHEETAARFGISPGDRIRVESPRGDACFVARVTRDIAPGVVSVDHGWWFPEKKETGYGVFESNANVLTSDAPPYDSAFGSYQLRGLLCRVSKVLSTPA